MKIQFDEKKLTGIIGIDNFWKFILLALLNVYPQLLTPIIVRLKVRSLLDLVFGNMSVLNPDRKH